LPAGSTVDASIPDGPEPAGTRCGDRALQGNLTARYTFDLWGGEAFGKAP
jgi:hypothetical protein